MDMIKVNLRLMCHEGCLLTLIIVKNKDTYSGTKLTFGEVPSIARTSSLLLPPSHQAPYTGVTSLPISDIHTKVNHGTFICTI